MISSEFIYFLIFVLISRLPFYFSERKLLFKQLVLKLIIQFFPLIFFIRKPNVLILVFTMIIIGVVEFVYENKRRPRKLSQNGIRTIELVVIIFCSSIIFSILDPIEVSSNFNWIFMFIEESFVITKDLPMISYDSFGIVTLGLLFLLNEVNLPIRSTLSKLKVIPRTESNDDEDELKSGRVIGMVERIIIYIFVLGGEYAALGLILAAKAYARSKRMDDHDFAEYVLIGTLVSTVFALIIGLAVKYLIGF